MTPIITKWMYMQYQCKLFKIIIQQWDPNNPSRYVLIVAHETVHTSTLHTNVELQRSALQRRYYKNDSVYPHRYFPEAIFLTLSSNIEGVPVSSAMLKVHGSTEANEKGGRSAELPVPRYDALCIPPPMYVQTQIRKWQCTQNKYRPNGS